jgi:hypothetical protein
MARTSGPAVELDVGEHTVLLTNPDRLYFDDAVFDLDELLEWAARDERAGEAAPPGPTG